MAHPMQHVLTLVAQREAAPLSAALLARVREAVRGDAPALLSPGEAAELGVPGEPDPAAVRAALEGAPVDAIATPAAQRRKRLLVADMDSTIVTGETLDELADFAGLKDRIAAITARAMNGELDFKAALRERVAHAGRPAGRCAGEDLAARAPDRRRARAGRHHAGAWRADRAGVRRVQLLHRAGRGAVRLRPAPLQRAAGRRCGADRAGGGADPRPRHQAGACSPAWRRSADCRRPPRWRWGTARTIWTCCARRAWAWRSTPSRSSRRPRGRGWTMPTCGPCCSRRATGRRSSSRVKPSEAPARVADPWCETSKPASHAPARKNSAGLLAPRRAGQQAGYAPPGMPANWGTSRAA